MQWQEMRTSHPWRQSQSSEVDTQLGVLAGDSEIAEQSDAKTRPDRMSIDTRNCGHTNRSESEEAGVKLPHDMHVVDR